MSITRILLRKGLDSARPILSEGEPGYATDSKRLYIGDGSTQGGVAVGTKFLGRVSFTSTGGVNYPTPVYPSYGDLIYETSTNLIYALTGTSWGEAGNWQAMGTNFNPDGITLTKTGTTVSVRTGGLSALHFSADSIGTGLTRTGTSNQVLRIAQPTSELTFTGNQLSIANAGVTNAKLANVSTNTVKGRIASGTGVPSDISLDTFSTVLSTFLAVAMPPVPTGTILDYAGSSIPSGYLECDGNPHSRTTYAGLFAVIGVTWGSGNGSTTFNVPDLRGKAAIGAGQDTTRGLTNRTLGSMNIGEENHLLTAEETGVRPHTHGVTLEGSSESQGYSAPGTNLGLVFNGGPNTVLFTSSNSVSSNAIVAHNTMQPSAVVRKIIKT